MNNKIVFLDFDGVTIPVPESDVFSFHNAKKMINQEKVFNDECVDRLNTILEKSGADLVICSGWRTHEGTMKNMFEILVKNGVKITKEKYLGITPDLHKFDKRGFEIQQWLDDNAFNGEFVILEDMFAEIFPLIDRLVNTNSWKGLTDENVQNALRILKVQDGFIS